MGELKVKIYMKTVNNYMQFLLITEIRYLLERLFLNFDFVESPCKTS